MPEPDPSGFWLDHVGWVCGDITPPIAQLNRLGFRTSEPTALRGPDGPLGQHSAHCVFENFYLEISAPVAGSGNHLEPLLAHGPGYRIVALGCENVERAKRHLSDLHIACSPLMEASRLVRLASGVGQARFRWIALERLIPNSMVAVVEHRDRQIVFAEELVDHPNGARRIKQAVLDHAANPLAELLAGRSPHGPPIVWDNASPRPVPGLRCDNGIFIGMEPVDG